MNKAIISGGNGFLGQHLQEALKAQEMPFVLLPRLYLYDRVKLLNFFSEVKPDYIFHLAAYGNMSNQKDEQEIVDANINALFNLLQCSKNIPYKALINVSSSSVTLEHHTMYAATKLAGEALCKAFVDEYKKPIVTVRPYSVYGPGEADFRFIPTVFRSCLTGEPMTLAPDAVHDWIYVDDLVKVLLASTQLEEYYGEPFGCGTGRDTSNGAIVEAIQLITENKANITEKKSLRSFDNMDWVDKVQKPTNYIPLADGLQKCYEYYKERYAK